MVVARSICKGLQVSSRSHGTSSQRQGVSLRSARWLWTPGMFPPVISAALHVTLLTAPAYCYPRERDSCCSVCRLPHRFWFHELVPPSGEQNGLWCMRLLTSLYLFIFLWLLSLVHATPATTSFESILYITICFLLLSLSSPLLFLSRFLRCAWRSAARLWLEDYAR